jgi:hypothetical protein
MAQPIIEVRPMIKTIAVALFAAGMAAAQISYGVRGGAPFTDVAKNSIIGAVQSVPKSDNFTVGPVLQVGLPLRLRLEVDALFRPYNLDLKFGTSGVAVRGQQWRFPAILQYRFGGTLVQPYMGVGVSFGHLSGLGSGAKTLISSGPGALLHENDASPVIGAGIDVKIPLVRLSGELRYTRQSVSYFSNVSNLNQAEFLLGIHF